MLFRVQWALPAMVPIGQQIERPPVPLAQSSNNVV